MTLHRHLIAAACLALAACGGGGGSDTPPPDDNAPGPADPIDDTPLEGELLVRLAATTDLAGVTTTHGLTVVDQFGTRPIYRMTVPAGVDAESKLAPLQADLRVLRAERNRTTSTPEGRRRSVWAIGDPSGYAAQWAPQAMRLPEAQAITTGSGVRIAVLDTGVERTHPALAGRLEAGYDFVDADADPSEVGADGDGGYGHGTHVAGLLALAAPGATLMPLRVLDAQGRGNVWVLAEALLYAADPDGVPETPDGAQVINLSMGTTQRTDLLDDIIDLVECSTPDDDDDDDDDDEDARRCAAQGGTVVIAAAGNDGSDAIRQYPAAEGVGGSLSVGATSAAGRRADFSNFGSWVTVGAPGDGITSSVPGGRYGVWSGTSMSAPLVAGVAALLRAAQPTLTPEEVTQRIVARAALLCDPSLKQVDALAVLRDVAPAAPACP